MSAPTSRTSETPGAHHWDMCDTAAGSEREIRAGRIVLVDKSGFERVVIEAEDGYSVVSVRARGVDGELNCVELFAQDPFDGDDSHVGVVLTRRGDVVATAEYIGDRPVGVWARPEPGVPKATTNRT